MFQDISLVYQIFTDDVLGSGQFGVVYRGELVWTSLLYYHAVAKNQLIVFKSSWDVFILGKYEILVPYSNWKFNGKNK